MRSSNETNPRDRWNPIDEALYSPGEGNLYEVKAENADSLRLNAIRFSFNHHYSHNSYYHDFCRQRGVSPRDITNFEDLTKIPMLPDNFFKLYPEPARFVKWLRAITADDIEYPEVKGTTYDEVIDELYAHGMPVTFSTGTSGRFTFIPKDRITNSRVAYTSASINKLLGSSPHPENYYFFFGPDPWRTLWVIAHNQKNPIARYQKERTFFMDFKVTTEDLKYIMGQRHGKTETAAASKIRKRLKQITESSIQKAINMLACADEERVGGYMMGPPFRIYEMLRRMEGMSLSLGTKWVLTTGGGWKGMTGVSEKAFRKKVEQVLGIPDGNCRDVYGMSESAVPFVGCEDHYFHIMNTLVQPFVLDSELTPKGFGEYGRLAFLNALAYGYPCYIITSDRVKLLENCPACGRPGPVIEPPVTRIQGAEDRGCASVMRKLMTEEMESA